MVALARRDFNRLMAGAAVGLVAQGAAPAQAADFSYKFGHAFPLNHPIHIAALAVATRVSAETNGVVDIEVLGASQLGGDNNLMSQVRSGGIDFYAGAGSVFATVFPIASIWAMGFAFGNYGEVWAAVDGELGDRVRAGARGVGLVPFDVVWDNGFREVSTGARPINDAKDLKGIKIRVPVSPSLISLFQNLGASPVSLNFGEVYTALQAHLVDAQESPLSIFETGNFYEVQKYLALTNHSWDGGFIVGNRASWAALPSDMQAIASRIFNEEGLKQRTASAVLADSLRASLTERGVAFTEPSRAAMIDVLKERGYYREWRQKYGEAAWQSLTRYSPAVS